MATIKQRKTKFSVIYWYLDINGERKQKWDTVNTKKEAKERKAFVEFFQQKYGYTLVPLEAQFIKESEAAKANKDSFSDNEDILFKDFLVIFVNLYGVSKWSVSTYSSKTASIHNYINPFLGNLTLSEITTKRLSVYYNYLLSVPEVAKSNRKADGRCLQPANIKKIHDIIRCALNQAIRWEYLDTRMRNPASLATLPKMTKVKRKVWNVETFKEALRATDDDLLSVCMHLAFACSLRVGEITGLTWDDIIIDEDSINNGTARVIVNKEIARVSLEALQKLKEKDIIRIFPTQKPHCTTRLVLKKPKTDSSIRTVWLPKTLANILAEYKKAQQELKEFLGNEYNDYNLAIALENGNPVESRIVRNRFQTLCEVFNFEIVVFHSLRHLSTKYKLKMTQGDIKSVQGDTGHAEAEMVTDVYSEIVDEDRRLNAKKLDDDFYISLDEEPTASKPISDTENSISNNDKMLLELLKSMSPEMKEQLLKQSLVAS